MGKLSSISKEGYIPSLDDILHSRSKTVGICEITFDFEDAHFKIVCFFCFFCLGFDFVNVFVFVFVFVFVLVVVLLQLSVIAS